MEDSRQRSSGPPTPLLRVSGVTKAFGGVKALDGAALELRKGEVHALLGANGAGKSTLIKVLNGIYRPDEGVIDWEGRGVSIRHFSDARALGIATMFQQLNVPGELTVGEYLTLGREKTTAFITSRTRSRAQARAALKQLGIEMDLGRLCADLSVAEKELMEIARAVSQDAKLVIMDEPTASLGAAEVAQLFGVIGRLRERDVSVIYVSHKLEEVLEISDRSTVLRDGHNVGTIDTADADEDILLEMMVGTFAKSDATATARAVTGPAVLQLKSVSTDSGLREVDLTLHRGEILGVYGLMGAGRTELLRAIFGLDGISDGSVEVHGKTSSVGSPNAARRLGMGLVPEDRVREAMIPDQSVAENLSLAAPTKAMRGGILRPKIERSLAGEVAARLGIKMPGVDSAITTLSGGNQQKVVLGRWLVAGADILLLDDPTVGVDVPAKHDIYRIVRVLAESGVSVLLCSSELSEILHLSDRIHVMHRRRIVAELTGAEADAEQLERLSILGGPDRAGKENDG